MKGYFEVIKITDEVFHIYEPGGVGSSLVIGKQRALLIDTGYGFADIAKQVGEITDLPLQIVNTHGHTDHTGGNRYFEQVWMNPEDQRVYLDYQTHQKPLIAARFEGVQKAAGKPNVWPEDFDRKQWYESGTREFLWLTDGQIFDLDVPEGGDGEGHRIETIFLAGHTGGSTMFFDWKNHILFPGDNLDYSLWIQFDASVPLHIYKEQLKRLEKYPIRGIMPAHRRKMLSPWLLKRMPEALGHLRVEKSRNFYHPRTGELGMLYKEPLMGESPEGMDTLYIAYQRNKM